MAELEQNVPTMQPQTQTYLYHPSRQQEGNKGLGKAFGELGSIIPEAAKLGVDITHTNIQGDVDRGVDRIRDDYTGRLQTLYENVSGKDTNLFDPKGIANQPPIQLQNRMKAIDALDAAKASGKYSETYLYGQYVQLAKEIRSQYPAFRDYVDERIDRSTGRGIANRYIASLTSDLNSYIGKKEDFQKDAFKQVLKEYQEGNNSLAPDAKRILSGDSSYTAAMASSSLNRTNEQKWTLARMEEIRKGITGDITMKKDMAQQQGAKYMAGQVADWFSAHSNLITRLNDDAVSTVEKQHIAEMIAKQTEGIRQDAVAYYNKQGLSKDLGDGWMTSIDNGLMALTATSKWMAGGDFGPIKHANNLIDAKKADFNSALFDSDMSADLMMSEAITKAGGGPGSKLQERLSEMERARNLDQRISTFVTNQGNKLMTGGGAKSISTEGTWNMGAPGSNVSPDFNAATASQGFGDIVKDTQERAKKAGIQSQPVLSRMYAGILKYFDLVKDKDTPKPIAENLAHAAFDKPWLSTFNKDSVDPSTGTPLIGQATIYAQFTDPKTDKMIFTQYGKDVQEKYYNWKTNEFAHTVFRNEIGTLDRMQNVEALGRFGYDTKTHLLSFEPSTNIGRHANIMTPEQGEIDQAIKRLNMGLGNLANLSKYTHEDPDAFILRTLHEGGLQGGKVFEMIKAAVHGAVDKDDAKVWGEYPPPPGTGTGEGHGPGVMQ